MPILLKTDDRIRVPLSRLGAKPHEGFEARVEQDGTIILTPIAVIPKREMIVWENPELRKSIAQGLVEASAGLAVRNPELDQELDELRND